MNRKRQPRELLTSIATICAKEWLYELEHDTWSAASEWAFDIAQKRLESLSPTPPKRSYYGPKGSLRNPF